VLLRWISERRSRGEERREEKRIAGPESAAESEDVDTGGWEEGEAVVGGLLVIVGEEDSRREA